MLPEAKEVAASACEADPSECKSRQATHLLSGCSLVRLKALPCRGRDRGSESLHPGQLMFRSSSPLSSVRATSLMVRAGDS